jgi:hypothetical protein
LERLGRRRNRVSEIGSGFDSELEELVMKAMKKVQAKIQEELEQQARSEKAGT